MRIVENIDALKIAPAGNADFLFACARAGAWRGIAQRPALGAARAL